MKVLKDNGTEIQFQNHIKVIYVNTPFEGCETHVKLFGDYIGVDVYNSEDGDLIQETYFKRGDLMNLQLRKDVE